MRFRCVSRSETGCCTGQMYFTSPAHHPQASPVGPAVPCHTAPCTGCSSACTYVLALGGKSTHALKSSETFVSPAGTDIPTQGAAKGTMRNRQVGRAGGRGTCDGAVEDSWSILVPLPVTIRDAFSLDEKLDGIGLVKAPLHAVGHIPPCLLYTSPSPRDRQKSRMPSSA